MQIRHASNPLDVKFFTTERLRDEFLVPEVMVENELTWKYSHYDRFMIGGAVPAGQPLRLEAPEALKATYFLERRELGIINTGAPGVVRVDGTDYPLGNKDCLYVGKGSQEVVFQSVDAANPARFFLSSTPAHHTYPVQQAALAKAEPTHLGAATSANERTIYKYIHQNGIQSCQLVMGLTMFKNGSLWNSIPCHTHDRRMEVYFYFDLPAEARVFHFMGESTESRHLVVANEEAIISPPWSVHFGVGTASYSFIWAMAGENQVFSDMDVVQTKDLK
ncbi:MAG: 5-dehydro-4-deoxy-D-glucuronate isomerase [Bacteroidota bacterium]